MGGRHAVIELGVVGMVASAVFASSALAEEHPCVHPKDVHSLPPYAATQISARLPISSCPQ